MTETLMHLSRVHFPVTALGPGRRLGIWFQGCSIRCSGCISLDTWDDKKGLTSVEEIMADVDEWVAEADGVTISGGEPFDQEHALERLLVEFRARTEADILVFSGYEFGKIAEHPIVTGGLADALITGPFRAEFGQTKALRGSDNQELYFLTDLGRAVFGNINAQSQSRHLDAMITEDGEVFFAGIPRIGEFEELADRLRGEGHIFVTSSDPRR